LQWGACFYIKQHLLDVLLLPTELASAVLGNQEPPLPWYRPPESNCKFTTASNRFFYVKQIDGFHPGTAVSKNISVSHSL